VVELVSSDCQAIWFLSLDHFLLPVKKPFIEKFGLLLGCSIISKTNHIFSNYYFYYLNCRLLVIKYRRCVMDHEMVFL